MKAAVISSDNETAGAFMLAGVKEAYVCRDSFETEKALKKIFNMLDVVVLFISSDLAEKVRDIIERRINAGEFYPIVVDIPPKSGKIKEDVIRMIVKRAVGVDMDDRSV